MNVHIIHIYKLPNSNQTNPHTTLPSAVSESLFVPFTENKQLQNIYINVWSHFERWKIHVLDTCSQLLRGLLACQIHSQNIIQVNHCSQPVQAHLYASRTWRCHFSVGRTMPVVAIVCANRTLTCTLYSCLVFTAIKAKI